jgi:tetratricopeptide (TPR) repeat protein
MVLPSVRAAILIAIVWLLALPGMAQIKTAPPPQTAISGTVRDAVTHQALARVVVVVESRDSGYTGQAETDTSGRFGLQGIGAGQFLVRVRFPGYDESDQEVDLSTIPLAYLNFELRPKPSTAPRAVAPEGPEAGINARLASVPEKARKEFTKARELWQGGKDPQECIDHLKKAVKDYPKFSDAYVLMASVYMQQGDSTDARTALNRAIEADPKLPEAWFTLGMLQNGQKDFPGAERSLTEGLKLDENAPQGHYELGKTYLALNRPDDAEQHAKKAAALQPKMAPVYILLGNIAWKKQDAAGALKEYQEYLKLDPNGPMAPGAQAMVKKIQDWFAQSQTSPQ